MIFLINPINIRKPQKRVFGLKMLTIFHENDHLSILQKSISGCTGANVVSGTSQFLLLSFPLANYGAGQATLGHFSFFIPTHILSRSDLGDGLK